QGGGVPPAVSSGEGSKVTPDFAVVSAVLVRLYLHKSKIHHGYREYFKRNRVSCIAMFIRRLKGDLQQRRLMMRRTLSLLAAGFAIVTAASPAWAAPFKPGYSPSVSQVMSRYKPVVTPEALRLKALYIKQMEVLQRGNEWQLRSGTLGARR